MRQVSPIFKKEFRSYFVSPIAYIVISIFLVVMGWFSFSTFFLFNQASLRNFFALLPIMFAFVIPAVTMRLFAEEIHTGSYEMLLTLPVTPNDVVVGKGGSGRLIDLEIAINSEFVYSQRADGLVVTTPTGTTAYALSAGGPIVHPTLEAVALVPICPHTLSARPIVVSSHSRIEIHLTYADDARVHFDGQSYFDLKAGDHVWITRASRPVTLLHPHSYSYYDTLRQKLHWGKKL